MSIARRIRRVGLLPTTYQLEPYTARVTVYEGTVPTVVEEQRTRRIPMRHRAKLTPPQRQFECQQIWNAAHVKRTAFRLAKRIARAAHKAKMQQRHKK